MVTGQCGGHFIMLKILNQYDVYLKLTGYSMPIILNKKCGKNRMRKGNSQ